MNKTLSKTLVFTDSDCGGVVHVANIKGGVGKSTVATNLAAALARRGPTLIIDLDVQGSATVALGLNPAECRSSAWQLLSKRFSGSLMSNQKHGGLFNSIRIIKRRIESFLMSQIVGRDEITSMAIRVRPCLDIIPATSELFNGVHYLHLQNLAYNLQLCRNYYKYIVIDTPSVWNSLTRLLYRRSDLTLIPVTLSALSTRSLRDYLVNVKKLAAGNSRVRIRIVKNEVFGSSDSAMRGKAVTMQENRAFLDGLCETIMRRNGGGLSLLPQSIIFDMEIPESAVVRNAQDAGQTVGEFKQYSTVAKAFEDLGKRVQHVFNSIGSDAPDRRDVLLVQSTAIAVRFAAVFIVGSILLYGKTLADLPAPRPVAPQQITQDQTQCIECRFAEGETMHKLAKFAICRFSATVPSEATVSQYAQQTIDIFNMTRLAGEAHISADKVPPGTIVRFYPPEMIGQDRAKRLGPVYQYFCTVVSDKLAYVTGDWCERGNGGIPPHYGMDVAASEGSEIVSPIDGIAYIKDSQDAGRVVGVVRDGMVLLFCHMDRRYVQSGQKIHAGEAVGTVGVTGHTTGPHVHIGYGIASSPGGNAIVLGGTSYRLTDPKLFFYREQYLKSLATNN